MPSTPPRWSRPLRWIALALLVVGLVVLVRLLPIADGVAWLQDWVADRGFTGLAAFGAAYFLAAVLFVPGSALTLAVLGALALTLVWAWGELGDGWGAFIDLFRGDQPAEDLTDALGLLFRR